MTRIAWSDDGNALLACAADRARVIAPTGEVMFAIDHEVVDARWTPRGVLSIDRACAIRCHDGGRLVDTRQVPGALSALAASVAAGGWRFARVERGWSVHSATGVELWRQRERIVHPHVAALSDDGCRFAVAHRGWAVVDIELDRKLDGGAGAPVAFAFDGRGEQLGIAMADGPSVVVRIGAPHPAPRIEKSSSAGPRSAAQRRGDAIEAPGGCAVALDRRGVLAAFAYAQAPPGARGRLRVDTLDGGDVMWLDCDLPDIAAIAFDPDSHRLACVATGGAVEVLPVP